MAPTFQENCLCTLLRAGLFVAGCTILTVCAFPVVQIVMGAVYMGSCPVAPALPVHLLVSGVGSLLLLSLLALPHLLCPDRHRSSLWTLWMVCLGLLYLAWFLYGSYIIYSVYPPQYTDSPSVPANSTSDTPVSSDQGPTHSWTPTHSGPSASVSSGPVPTHSGPSAAVRSGPVPTRSGPSAAVRSGPVPTRSRPSAAVRSGPVPTHSGPSAAVRSGPVPTRSGPSAVVRSGPEPTHSGDSAAVRSGPVPTRSGPSAVVRSGRGSTNSRTPTHSGPSELVSSSHTGASSGGQAAAVSSGPYCHRSLYLFAFWSHTLVYVFAGNALVLLLCLCCFMKLSALVVKHLTT